MTRFFINIFSRRNFGARRSSKWRKVRKEFLKKNPRCVACGKVKKLRVHHCIPFHIDSSLELEKSNLITLCQGKVMNCHFVFGHCFLNWKCYNKNIEEDIKFITNLRQCAITKQQVTDQKYHIPKLSKDMLKVNHL